MGGDHRGVPPWAHKSMKRREETEEDEAEDREPDRHQGKRKGTRGQDGAEEVSRFVSWALKFGHRELTLKFC
jgi:hypothetical protein